MSFTALVEDTVFAAVCALEATVMMTTIAMRGHQRGLLMAASIDPP
jgi:hypothetical protein